MLNGITLLINILNGEFEPLSNYDIIKLYLIRIVQLIKMTPVLETLTIKQFPIPIQNRISGDFGISGMMILVESHVSIHTWPELNYARVEVSTCKRIEQDYIHNVINFTKNIFGINSKVEYSIVHWLQET